MDYALNRSDVDLQVGGHGAGLDMCNSYIFLPITSAQVDNFLHMTMVCFISTFIFWLTYIYIYNIYIYIYISIYIYINHTMYWM